MVLKAMISIFIVVEWGQLPLMRKVDLIPLNLMVR